MRMTDRDIAIRLLALDESGYGRISLEDALAHYAKFAEAVGCECDLPGDGECAKCVFDEAMGRADMARKLFGIEPE